MKLTKEELRQYWQKGIAEFKKSDENKSKWCRDKKINLKTFCNWHTKYNKETNEKNIIAKDDKKSAGFITINVKEISDSAIIPKRQ